MDKEQLITQIIEACKELGWQIVLPNTDGEEEVTGLVIGTEEYINNIFPDEV